MSIKLAGPSLPWTEREIIPFYKPRRFYQPTPQSEATWRRTHHFMGKYPSYRQYPNHLDPVYATVELGYGLAAQSLKAWQITTDHSMIVDPIELSITFSYRGGGGAMGKNVLDDLVQRSAYALAIANIAERWHLNGVRSRCDCMPLPYPNWQMKEDDANYNRAINQRCTVTEISCGHAWWHEPLPDPVIAMICSWPSDPEPRDLTWRHGTIIDGRRIDE